MKKIICFLIAFYQYAISRHLPHSCRFCPSCSSYAREAVEKHGAFRGVIKSILRLARCHPFSSGGYDPVK